MTDSDRKSWRGPPAFQMYAPDRLASRHFKAMSAAERGLLHTMELELWVNSTVPCDIRELARVLGMEAAEVKSALTPRVLHFFERREGSECVYVSPDLEAYRQQQRERHARQSEGGRRGAKERWQSNKNATTCPNGLAIDQANGPLRGEEQRGAEQNRVYKKGGEHDEFIAELDGPSPFEEAIRGRNGN